ncbi:septum formation family protein [Pseudonocardia sp. GCM10023141]|uniref:septum formation family protein n=1 Tax=Pseudonocardia sp. GCM10023141 TaxID=3252653 RepID=UPI00360AFF57
MDRLLTAPRPAERGVDGPGGPGNAQHGHRHGAPSLLPPSSPFRAAGGSDRPQPGRSRPEPRPVRRVVMGVLIGALTMLGVATLDTFAGATVPVLGTLASLPAPAGGRNVVEVPAPPATPGTCLNWSRPDAADAVVVDCAAPHLFEQMGSITLVDQPTLPDDRQWRQLVNERCNPVVVKYLGGKYDPDGKLRVGALKPSAAKWAEGDRELRCGVQSSSHSGALYPMAGKAADSDQSSVQQPGTCLAIDGRTPGDPVSCSGPHAVETVGIVDTAAKFPDAFPAVGDQDAYLQPECTKLAAEYAGSADVIAAKKLTVYWDNLTEESWKAGTRKVNCNLAALLPDRSGFAPVTGSVRGDVVVGEKPAPPATNTPEPGAPAPPTSANPTPEPSAEPTKPPSDSNAPATPTKPPTGGTPPGGGAPSATPTPAGGIGSIPLPGGG